MELASLVDAYRLVDRVATYGVLIVALVFVAFFLFEVRAGLRVHPFQYTLIGAALCLFFLVPCTRGSGRCSSPSTASST